ncbi:hypothetical protein BD769DRAFT_1499836 [Suillus cothurnatus]|nr:hypothetical protein BD769DRAFT_1499836 [Suillus cothurnatus]
MLTMSQLNPGQTSAHCMGLSASLFLFPSIMVGAAAFNPRAYTIQFTSRRSVNHVLKEEVDTIIGADYVDINPTAEKTQHHHDPQPA